MTTENEDRPDFKHPDYVKNMGYWRRCRLVIEGTDAVKDAGVEFLPMLGGQDPMEYEKYKGRALFFEASGRTTQGLLGALCGKEPQLVGPEGKDDFFTTITSYVAPIKSFIKKIAEEVITVGRCGLLIDVSGGEEGGDPNLVFYAAESIFNWHTRNVDGKDQLTLVVLREEVTIPGRFSLSKEVRYRVLSLDPITGNYVQEVFVERASESGGNKTEFTSLYLITPTKGGQPLKFIPFTFINSNGTTPAIALPPLIGLVNVNISHYRTEADLSHGLHFTALPIIHMSGFTKDTAPDVAAGSEVVWVTPKGTTVEYLEFSGVGLGALTIALKEKEAKMVVLGASLLASPKPASESADNQRIRRSGENNVISNIADSVSEGLTTALIDLADWRGIGDSANVSVSLNKEYTQDPANPQLLAQLINMLQSGAMSLESFHFNLSAMGLLPDGSTPEGERELVQEGDYARPVVSVPPTGAPGAEPDTDTEGE